MRNSTGHLIACVLNDAGLQRSQRLAFARSRFFLPDLRKMSASIFGLAWAVSCYYISLQGSRWSIGSSARGAAVGTVIWFQKIQGRRRGAAIKYLFRASDGTLHLGNARGSMRLAKENKTLGIIYSADNPSRSMLLSQFWFYDFSQVATREGTDMSEVRQS
jgi:hypothetical protein